MISNRSMPPGIFIPELAYPDVADAAAWLCRAFGFRERLRIGNHRIQLIFGEGSCVVIEGDSSPSDDRHRVMVRVENVDAHCEQARHAGAAIVAMPADHPYGERQYAATDPAGHRWVFSQSIADSDPASWGGELVQP
jgi:uncharacterized glyoxalase superfamily protein PhnB